MMAAPKGNNFGLALKDPEMRQRAYQSFCDHLAKGKAIKSWFFIEGNCACSWLTMQEYMKNTEEFNPLQMQIAQAHGYQYWEGVVQASAEGKNKDANTASLQMLMRNKFGWDKEQKNSNNGITVRIDKDGLGSGINISTETVSTPDHSGSQSGD